MLLLESWKTSSILLLLERCLQTCMTYTFAECTVNKLLMMDRIELENQFHPGPARKLSTNLYDMYLC